MKITDKTAAALKLSAGKADQIWFDDSQPGFGVRIRKGGSSKYIQQYRFAGSQRRATLGVVGVITTAEARAKGRKILVTADDGRDPAAEKATTKAAASVIFQNVCSDYLEARKGDMKPRSHVALADNLNRLWKPLHGLALASITRATVASELRTIAKVNGPVAANRARSALSAFFGWAIGEGVCDINPVVGTNKSGDEKTRDRVLSDAELVAIWNAAPATDYGRIVRLLMLTGQRRDEIGSMQWSELEGAYLRLPGSRTKNGRQHDVYLGPMASAVLSECVQVEGREFVFGYGKGGYSGWSRSKAGLDDACGVSDWTLHDLRRTMATRMADLGVQPHVIEAALNHVSGHKAGVAGIYNRSAYVEERKAAALVWEAHLKTILAKASGANVTVLQRA